MSSYARMISRRLVLPFVRAYAGHVGLAVAEPELREELGRRLSAMPWWARAHAAAGAIFLRWASPALVLGRWRRFEGLPGPEREELLRRHQHGRPALRALFLGAKSLALSVCYGRPQILARIGYRPGPGGGP